MKKYQPRYSKYESDCCGATITKESNWKTGGKNFFCTKCNENCNLVRKIQSPRNNN